MWTELLNEINGNPFMAGGFYGILGVVVAIPMKVMSRLLTRVPVGWINRDTAPAIIAFPTLLAAWFLVRAVPLIDDNALFVALGLSSANALIGRRVLTPSADAIETMSGVRPPDPRP